MTDLDILCPASCRINILGRECTLKPFTLKQSIELGRILGQMHREVLSSIEQDEGQNVISKIFELAGTNKLKEIINILTAEQLKDVSNIEDKITLQEVSLLVKEIGRINNFEAIILNFKTALKGLSK